MRTRCWRACSAAPRRIIAALVPNARGAERALGAGVDEIVCFVSASETHNQANLNASIDGSLAERRGGRRARARHGVALRGAVACAFGCPFEGEVPVDAAMRIVDAYAKLGFDRLTLGDTTGMATPPTVARARRGDRAALPAAADRAALPQHARRRPRQRHGRARPRHSRVRVVDRRSRRLPVRARRDRQHLHRGSRVPARGIGLRHRHRPRRADRGRAPRRGRHRAPAARAGDEGRSAAAQVFARGRCAAPSADSRLRIVRKEESTCFVFVAAACCCRRARRARSTRRPIRRSRSA